MESTESLAISNPEMYAGLRDGFGIPGSYLYQKGTLDEYIESHSDPVYRRAFADGVELKKCVIFLFSADNDTDFQSDIRAYDACVKALNKKYGQVALLSSEIDHRVPAYGLVGHRAVPWSTITISDQAGNTAVTFLEEQVSMEDEKIREELHLQ